MMQRLGSTMNATASTAPAADSGVSDDAHELHHALSDLLRAVQFRDRDRICCHDISVTQCYALEVLAGRGEMRSNELAAALYLDKSTTSRVVDGLVRKGYAERRPDPEDGRAVQVRATDEGLALYERIEADLLGDVEALIGDLAPEVRRAAVRLVRRLAEAGACRIDAGGGCCRLREAE
jgi:MarR family transcriptional regulator, 2-MHQ and catechol-resistance regulon repressor